MMKVLQEILDRAHQWPEYAQKELAQVVREIDAEVESGFYHPTKAELKGIDRGLKAVREGRFAPVKKVKATFAKFRRA